MSRIRLLYLPCCLLALLASSRVLKAQVSVYGAIALTNYGISNNSGSNFYYKSDTAGFVVGTFYNFPIQSRLTAGLDLRLTESPGSNGGTTGALAFRIGFVPHQVRLRPYFEIGGGLAHTSTTPALFYQVKSGTYTSGGVFISAGLDVRVTHSLDIRAFELAGEAGSDAAGGALDGGVVFHFGAH